MLWRAGKLPTLPSAAGGKETEGEVAMGLEDDTQRTGIGCKILVVGDGKGIAIGR